MRQAKYQNELRLLACFTDSTTYFSSSELPPFTPLLDSFAGRVFVLFLPLP